MKTSLRKILFFTLYYIGIGIIIKNYNNKRGKIPILLFHRVSNENDPFWEPLTPLFFDKLFNFLSKKYDFISVENLFELSPEKAKSKCLVTFDDGYDDFKNISLPILKKYGIKPTFFITTNCISNNQIIWTSELNKTIENTIKSKLKFNVNGSQKEYALTTIQEKKIAASSILNVLKLIPNESKNQILGNIKEQLSYQKPVNLNMLSWEEIISLKEVADIESHTLSHPMMTNLDDNELIKELNDSKSIIATKLNKEVKYISYPIGDYNEKVANCTKNYYKAAFKVDDELVNINKIKDEDYKYQIPRINITDKSVYEVFFRINGFHSFFKKKK